MEIIDLEEVSWLWHQAQAIAEKTNELGLFKVKMVQKHQKDTIKRVKKTTHSTGEKMLANQPAEYSSEPWKLSATTTNPQFKDKSKI